MNTLYHIPQFRSCCCCWRDFGRSLVFIQPNERVNNASLFFSCCMYVCLPFNRKMFIFWQTFLKKSSLLLLAGQSTTNVDFSKWSELSEGGRVLWNILTEKDIENCISSSSSIIRKKYYLLILLPTYLLMVLVRWSARWISYTIGLLALKKFCRITVFTIYI